MITPSQPNESSLPPNNPPPIAPEGPSSFFAVVDTLLKRPGRIVHELENDRHGLLAGWLLLLGLFGLALYGLVVGSFSGGAQLWIAPVKLGVGATLSMLICLPSLYIFSSLSGIEALGRTIAGVLFGAVALSALLLIGFAPVAWIFSQATDSAGFIAALHIGFWSIGMVFGLRLVLAMNAVLRGSTRGYLKLWGFIFVAVCLQMVTTLRPIMGTAPHFLPTEKKFFLAHWFETISGPAQ